MKKLVSAITLGLAIAGVSAALEAKPASRTAARDWQSTIRVTPEGNAVMGNPAAPIKLVEFVSFTCDHCAHFTEESNQRLRGDLVRRGQVSVELRPIVFENQPFGLVAALLAQCGQPARWFGNGDAILAAQQQWIPKVLDPALQQRWNALPANQYALAMARDIGFYPIMQSRGYTAAQIDACLTDPARQAAILKTTNHAFQVIGISGTPSFMINDSLLSMYDWPNLDLLIDSMLPQ
ncbi:MAG: thioredoxin domain-containing protein [Novosphingobium sp.]|uniref:DsbA family protein n=1 Tax=Novosphingobium sp. TaxID=1874826 RepID=UPI0032BB7556